MEHFAVKTKDTMYVIFRILFGLLYAMHGLSKIGGLGKPAMTGFMFFIGVCELLIGLGVLLGLFTRLAAIGGFVIMAGALITAHFPKGINPMANGGELALLFLIGFLLVFAFGARKFHLSHAIFKREVL
jgi:putative oxidoreductase